MEPVMQIAFAILVSLSAGVVIAVLEKLVHARPHDRKRESGRR